MRKLASIQKILSLSPIAGADKIELATILGWQVVVGKSEGFKVGDLVVYFEVDSQLPERPEFEFLRQRKFRVKTIKLRGVISQGLVMPMLSVFPEGFKVREGTDVSEILGVTKYDPEGAVEADETQEKKSFIHRFMLRFAWYRKLFKNKKSNEWPKFIEHTDEDRIQLFPNICKEEEGTEFYVTEKIDGQSATYFLKKTANLFRPYVFGVCSRKVYLKSAADNNYWKIAKKYKIEKALKKIIGGRKYVILQGEIYGEGVQGNKYSVKGLRFAAFNLIFPQQKMSPTYMSGISQKYGIPSVPLLAQNFTLPSTIQECVSFSVGKSEIADTQREGIVVRNYERGISFKIINPEFLLKWGI